MHIAGADGVFTFSRDRVVSSWRLFAEHLKENIPAMHRLLQIDTNLTRTNCYILLREARPPDIVAQFTRDTDEWQYRLSPSVDWADTRCIRMDIDVEIIISHKPT